jgi:hypothetical protein
MNVTEKGVETQLNNIQAKTGKTLDELRAIITGSGLTKHSEIRAMLQRDLDLSFVHADTLILCIRQIDEEREAQAKGVTTNDVVDQIYTGPKANLRPIHDKLMARIQEFGPFEVAPKKGYVSLRRKKQFTMIGPATNSRVEIGLNMKSLTATDRLVELPAGNLCSHKVKLTDPDQVDDEVIEWIKRAYEHAG